jgi:hypothetical protein
VAEVNTFNHCFGGYVADPVTGVVGPTQLALTEHLDSSRDVRRYEVTHTHNYSHRELRKTVFTAASYMGGPENWCGTLEATQARELFRAWQAQGWAVGEPGKGPGTLIL